MEIAYDSLSLYSEKSSARYPSAPPGDPSSSPKPTYTSKYDRTHESQHSMVGPRRSQLRHILEVHAVDSSQQSEGQNNGGHNGQDPHCLVLAVGYG